MKFLIEPLLTPEQCINALRALNDVNADWRPGTDTAGWHAKTVKRNRQLYPDSHIGKRLALNIEKCLLADPLLQAAAFPRCINTILFSRYSVNQGYGSHVDNVWMAGQRTDLSFTLALTSPDDYEGGALVLESPTGEESFRLKQGHALVYPSTMLHRVEPVTAGERFVAVGWIESHIRHADQRELLFELDTARRVSFERNGKDQVFDLITRSYSNLLRRWDS